MTYGGHNRVGRYDGSTPDAWLAMKCGHCGREVSAAVVSYSTNDPTVAWIWCSSCGEPSARDSRHGIWPGSVLGPSIEGLPGDVAAAYDEARRCLSVGANTATELLCRKILMHVAVDKGAEEGDSFAAYLAHLEVAGYVTPPMRSWVGRIREHGNEANHRLAPTSRDRAEDTLMFTAELLRLTYEMEHLARQYGIDRGSQPSNDPDA